VAETDINAKMLDALEAVARRSDHNYYTGTFHRCLICQHESELPLSHESWCPIPLVEAAIAAARGTKAKE
jgi:hypothetical protein